MKLKRLKFKSKKGMTLVELLVGITIIVIVFASTLGAMVNGYTTTVENADQSKVSAQNAAVNEVVMRAVQAQKWTSTPSGAPFDTEASLPEAIKQAALSECSDIVYVKPSEFPIDSYDNQYTIIVDSVSSISSGVGTPVQISGITIKTAMSGAAGPNVYESFVPYKAS